MLPSGSLAFPPPPHPLHPPPPSLRLSRSESSTGCAPVELARQLSDVEARLLRGMTVSVTIPSAHTALTARTAHTALTALTAHTAHTGVDSDCWLAFDKLDGFLLCLWNYSSGELREVCMSFVTEIEFSAEEGVLTLVCQLQESTECESGASSTNHSDTFRFSLQQSTTPSADKFDMSELHCILRDAKEWVPVPEIVSQNIVGAVPSTATNASKMKKRASVHATPSKRTSILHIGGEVDKSPKGVGSSGGVCGGNTEDSNGAEEFPGVSTLIDKFSSSTSVSSDRSRTLLSTAKCGSVRSIFGSMEDLQEEDEENDDDEAGS